MAVAEVRKKWHIPPAFNVEYVAYYEDRNNRILDLKVGSKFWFFSKWASSLLGKEFYPLPL